MPIGDPNPSLGLIGALAGNLDANHWIARIYDGADDAFDCIGHSRYAVPDRAPQMVLNGDAAYLGEALVDLQIAAVGRETSQPDRRRIINKLQLLDFRPDRLEWRDATPGAPQPTQIWTFHDQSTLALNLP